MVGPRFEQTAQQFQPMPLSAMQLTAEQPIRLVTSRTATCDGGGGALGHPRVFINLDKKGPRSCGYWSVPVLLCARLTVEQRDTLRDGSRTPRAPLVAPVL